MINVLIVEDSRISREAFERQLAALPDDEARFAAWYEDNWHPNAAGHALYARVVWEGIRGLMNTEDLRLKK